MKLPFFNESEGYPKMYRLWRLLSFTGCLKAQLLSSAALNIDILEYLASSTAIAITE